MFAQAYQFYREYIYPDEPAAPVAVAPASVKVGDRVQQQSGDAKDKVVKLKGDEIKSSKSSKKVAGDMGQASDADKDMYTTRSK